MKHILLILMFTLIYISTSAQICGEKGILTDPLNSYPNGRLTPINPEKNSAVSLFNWRLNPLIDGVNFKFTPINGTTKYLLSPWHVSDPNVQYNAMAKGTNSDYKPSDGWEVFKVNLGRLNDDVTPRLRVPIIPYIILYNKYTGILRVFAYLDRTNDYNSINVQLSTNAVTATNGLNCSAILSLHNEIAQPLDQKTTINEVETISKYYNNQSMFFWADFPLAYDPCVCQYKSTMNVDFKAITTGTITMSGTIIGNIVPIASNSSNPIAGIANAVTAITHVGRLIATGNYLDIYDAVAGVLGITNISPEFKNALDMFKNVVSSGQTLDNLNTPDRESVSKTLTAVNNFFSSALKSGSSASMLIATAKLTGDVKSVYQFGDSPISFSTPGSKDSQLNPEENYNNNTDAFGNVLPEYPAYNEILGTFALLKKPVVNISYTPFSTSFSPTVTYTYTGGFYIEHSRIRYSFPQNIINGSSSLANTIRYAFNPILHTNYNNTKIKVALVVRSKMGYGYGNSSTLYHPLYIGIFNNNNFVNLSPIAATYPNMTEIITPWSYSGDPSVIDGYQQTVQMGTNYTGNPDIYEFISPLVPLDNIYDLQGELSLYGTNFSDGDMYGIDFSPSLEDVRLKFFIDFESNDINSNGSPNKSTLIFTYPLTMNVTNEFPIIANIDLTQPRPHINPVDQTQIDNFCINTLDNVTYHGKELQVMQASSNLIEREISKDITKNETLSIIPKSSVYPNPAKGEINIKYTLEAISSIYLKVYSINMQELKTIYFNERTKGLHTEKINISNLSPGTYVLKIVSNKKSETIQFLVKP